MPGQVQIDHEENSFFQTTSVAYRQYQQYIDHYPSEQRDLLLITEFHPDKHDWLDTFKLFHLTLEQQDGIDSVLSILSAAADTDSGIRVPDSGLVRNQLVSTDSDKTLLLLGLEDAHLLHAKSLSLLIETIMDVAAHHDFSIQVAGLPALRIQLRDQVQGDVTRFTVVGFLLALILLWFVLKQLLTALLVLLAPAIAVLTSLGVMAISGVSLNVLTQVLVVFIVVIGASDSLHLVHRLKHMHNRGISRNDAIHSCVTNIIPACLLTSVTTAVGFLSLCTSQAVVVQEFGFSGFVGSLIVLIIVVLSLPLLAANCYQRNTINSDSQAAACSLRRYRQWVVSVNHKRNAIYLFSLLLIASAIWVSSYNESRYDMGENLAKDNVYTKAMATLQEGFKAAQLLVVQIKSTSTGHTRGKLLRQVDSVQEQLNNSFENSWLSIRDLIRSAPGRGINSRLRMLPQSLQNRFWDPENSRSAILTYSLDNAVDDDITQATKRVSVALESSFDTTEWTYSITGFPVIANESSKTIMSDLLNSLLLAILVVLSISIALFKKINWAFLVVIPSLFSVLSISFLLAIVGEPVRYAYILLFSVCFGLSVDSAIHILMAYRQGVSEKKRPIEAMAASLCLTIPPSFIAIIIVSLGFALMTLSASPTLTFVGIMGAVSVIIAFVFSLILIPIFTDKEIS